MTDLINSIDHLIASIKETKGTNCEILVELDNVLKKLTESTDFKIRETALDYLALLLLDPPYSSLVATSCSTIILELILRSNKFKASNCDKIQFFYILSEFICLYPEISEFVYLNFNQNFDPFSLLNHKQQTVSDQPKKKFKSDNDDLQLSLIKILNSCLNYLYFNSEWFVSTWNWSNLFNYLDQNDKEIKFLIYHCLRVIFNLSDKLFYKKLDIVFNQNDLNSLRLKYSSIFENKKIQLSKPQNQISQPNTAIEQNLVKANEPNDSDIVSIDGILLKKINNQATDLSKFVLFDSFKLNLQQLALAVRLDQPVLIEGPVGCGKTSLVECLANYVNRSKAPEITKLQMGDQIDRKVLIGSYHCTEIPGQFVWKAGPIVKALMDGNWIVLEDIDLAPNELINDIVTILKTKSLDSISGCSFISGKVHSSFRIFFTRRLIEGHSEMYRLTDHDVIYKLCERIQFDLPNREELKQIIKFKWPNLETFSNKLIDIFNLVQTNQLTSKTNRKITLRDLIKLCNRISATFQNTNKEAFTLLLDTCDCFINYISGQDKKLELAKQIGVLFNFTGEQVNSIYAKRKPAIEINDNQFKIGRYTLPIHQNKEFKEISTIFAFNLQSLLLLEQITASISHSESLLLVGETGCGKTSTIQFLASKLKKNLVIINLNQQTDSTDIIGGYKPIAFNFIAKKLKSKLEELFKETFPIDQNIKFLNNLLSLYETKKWKKFIIVLDHITSKALKKDGLDSNLAKKWNLFKKKLDNLKNKEFEKFLAFEFIEGNLVNAIKNGDWVLLDEINLAEAETLQFLAYILDENNQSFTLLDKNDDSQIARHNDFRLFACMNPSTDVGKKELPIGVRNLFTEIFVEELELTSDLQILTQTYIGNLVNSSQIEKIVQLYLRLKKDSKQSLNGYSSGPYYSLRTFCRALRVSSTNLCKNIKKTLYEAFCLSFLTQLDQKSHEQVQQLIYTYLFGKEKINLDKILTPKPDENAIELENFLGYWLPKGTKYPNLDSNYIITDSVRRNLFNLIRIISIGQTFPILLQGETSVGKTSMIEWLAQATGNVCYRINNHDHIDLQEYVGNYTVDKFGKLVFKEGLLVEAMRNGYWLILDELNLASTEVLEALNRVLDDNREIFIPEIQHTVKAHPKFLLFATQNPPQTYGGRKILSRAFRNRFIELQFDEIPRKELEIILSRRCHLPPSYSKKMVDVFRELRNRRRESGIFAGKSGFVTLRDLFRWGERYKEYSSNIDDRFFDWEKYLANEGYMLIGGRVRKDDELVVVKEVLEMKFKTQITDQFLNDNFNELIKLTNISDKFKHIVWTKNSIRLCCLLFRALKYKEPVLLVGETGCGKTTFCQLYADIQQHELYTVNCHMNTESSDFIGSLRPVRSGEDNENNKLFSWSDGPLVNAMNNGSTFLVDEISLADDSVLERLNSLLEPKRTLFLAEKTISEDYVEDQINGENESIKVVAKDSFRFIGTMNPGGDYAKKELSPALRNRFTEIWCSSAFDEEDIKKIIIHNLNSNLENNHIQISNLICEFLNWFTTKIITKTDYSIRDILTIIEFINTTTDQQKSIILPINLAVLNSIELLYIDSIGSSAISSFIKPTQLKKEAKIYLNELIKKYFPSDIDHSSDLLSVDTSKYYGFNSFFIPYGSIPINQTRSYIMSSKSVNANCSKVLKAMQLSKSILLEGVPGVGKTSLIDALAKAAGYQLIRINLSEQTDINDLFGADLPVEGIEAKFSWRDGPLLKALKTESTWVLLDELNLASQSVLEGLNACLDHRGEIFIPELNRTFKLNKEKTRIFASQNPHLQGGGRKGLPKSFMNRFVTIFIDSFSNDDMIFILENIFNQIPKEIIKKMVNFNEELIEETNSRKNFSSAGFPWEFNLRDMTRWCELVEKEKYQLNNEFVFKPENFIDLIYIDRFRTLEDRNYAIKLFEKHFNTTYSSQPKGFQLTKSYLQVGNSILKRKAYLTSEFDYQLLPQQTKVLESIMKCCEMGWMSILIGESNVSKSSIVKLLSILTGNTLKILSVNSEMDSTELLGGFEQQDCARHYKELEKEVWSKLKSLFNDCFMNEENMLNQFKQVIDQWFSRNNKLEQDSDDDVNLILEKLSILKDLLNYVNDDELKQKCTDLIELINRTKSINGNGTFEWLDSVLIESIQKGHWLLIDNANLCSASVLDRINSLLEPNGFLVINERGSINNEIPLIRPHPEFRLFLTMNHKQGELSRAMRNRGIEIYLTNQNLLNTTSFILKSLDNSDKRLERNQLLSLFIETVENQKDLKEKLTSKFFSYYLLYLMKNLKLEQLNEMPNTRRLNLKEELFPIRSLMGDRDLFTLQNSLELINNLDDVEQQKLYESIAFRLILESTSKNAQLFLQNIYSSSFNCDEEMISNLLTFNREFLDTNQLDVNELTLDLRYSLMLIKKLITNRDTYDQISLRTNIWSAKLFYSQLENYQKLNLNHDLPSLSVISQLSTRNQFEKYLPKLFIDSLTKLLCKFKSLKFDPNQKMNDDQYFSLRSNLNWVYHLVSLCQQNLSNTNEILIALDKFVNLWIICFQKDIFSQLSSFQLNIDDEMNEVNQSLNINFFDNSKDYDKLIKKFAYEIVPKSSNISTFYSLVWQSMNDLFSKNFWFLLKNQKVVKQFVNIYKNFVSDQEFEQIETELKFISEKLRRPDAFELKLEDDESKIDLELKQKFLNNQLTFEANLLSIYQMMFFVMEIQAIDLSNNQQDSSSIQDNLKSILSSTNVIINPFHQYLFQNSNSLNKFELILHHYLDSFKLFRNDSTFNLVNFHDTFNLDLNKEDLTQYEFKLKGFLKDNYWYKEEFIANTSPVFTLILTKALLQDNLRLGYLNYQQKQVEEIMKLIPENYLSFFGTFLNSKIYYENLFVCWVNLLAEKTADLSRFDSLRASMEQIVEQLKLATSIGQSNYLMCFIGIFTCKLFQPINALDPVQRSSCKLSNYELELNLINVEIELREKLCRLNYGRNFNSDEDHPHVQLLLNRKDDLLRKIEKLSHTQNFRPIPSLYFALKSSINHFMDNVINHQNFETSLTCLKNYIDSNENELSETDLMNQKISENIEMMVNFKKQINYFINDLLSKYSQYYDLLCNYLIGICLIYQSISWILSNANKKLALRHLNINSKLLNKINYLFSYSNCEPNQTTDNLLSFLNSTKLTEMLAKTRSGLQHCHTMLYKATLMEILNAFAFQTDHNQTVKLMHCLIQKFLDTWKKQEELKRIKQEEEEALYHYKVRNQDEIVNDEEQLTHDVNLNFPTYDDLYSDLMDVDENRQFQLNRLEQQVDEDDVYLKPEIILEIIDLHRSITESICKDTKLEFNFKDSFKLRYSILSELIESYGPLFDQTLDETVLDGHLIIFDNLNQSVFNQQLDSFNIYTDYNVQEIKRCFDVLEKLKNRIFQNLEDQMFCGHVTLRRLLKFILRIYSIQVTQPLIKFLTGLEIILQIAQEFEEIAPREFKLVNELEEVKELIISWRQIELKNYHNCLNNVFKRIRNQDFLKWWFHFYSILTEILSTENDNETILNDFYTNLKKFIDESSIGEFSNRLILIENFILHATCVNSNHQVILLMRNLLNYYKQIEPKIIDHIKNIRKEFDDQIKDKVKIIKWKKVNYFGLKNLITKSHRIVMRNMNKFTRSLGEQSYLHFYNFNTMIEQPKPKWELVVFNLRDKLILNGNQSQLDSVLISNLKCLNNLHQFNQKCCKLIVKCLDKSVVYENRVVEFNELSNDIIINIKDLQTLSVDSKLTDKEKRKKQIKSITNKKDHQLSELLKLLKAIGLSYRRGLNNVSKLNPNILQTVKQVERSSYLSEQSNLDIESTETYFYKLFNKFIYFLDASKLPAKDVNQQKLDRLQGSILHLVMKIVENRSNLFDRLSNYNEINEKICLLGKLSDKSVLTKKLANVLDLMRNSSIQLKILLVQCKDVLSVIEKSKSEMNETMKSFYNEIPKLIKTLDDISIPKVLPLFYYTKEEITIKINKLNGVVNRIEDRLTGLLNANNKSKNGVLMGTLQFALDLKSKLVTVYLNNLESLNIEDKNQDGQTKFNQLVDETEQFIQKVLFKIQESFKYLSSNDFDEIKSEDEENLVVDLEKIENLAKILGIATIRNLFESYLERTQIVGLDVSLSECDLIKKLLASLVTFLNNYLVCAHHYINLYIAKSRCLNKFTYILLGLFNELNKNGFCIPPDLQEENEEQKEGQFKEIDDAGFGEGQGSKDVSDQIQNLNQIEGLQNDDKNEEQKEEENKKPEDEMKEEDKGVQMDDDFKGETFDKEEKGDESEGEDSSDEENEMGDVENDDNVLDENIWGDDDEESSEIDENEKGTDNKKGEDQSNDQLVANEDNENLDKTAKEDKQKEFESKLDEEEANADDNDIEEEEYDENEKDQFKDKDEKTLDQNETDLPDDLELGDLEENESEEEMEDEQKEDLEVSELDDGEDDSNNEENEKSENLSDSKEDEENNEKSEKLNLDDEIKVEKDEEADEKMEVDDNDNALENRTDNCDENKQFNEDFKNKNESMNQQQSSNEEQDTGLDKQQQKALSYENKSSLITEQTLNEDQMEGTNDLKTENKDNDLNESNKKLSENIDKNLKRRDILKNESKKKQFKEEKKENKKSDLYRHIDDNMSGDEDIMDKADELHRNNIEIENKEEEEKDDESKNSEKLNDIEMLEDEINDEQQRSIKRKNQNDELTMTNDCKDENLAKDNNLNELESGTLIPTTFLQRPSETTFHTDLNKLDKNENSRNNNMDKLEHIDNLLNKLSSDTRLEDEEVDKEASLAWRECEQIVSPLVNELTAQLQLILEPTRTTKFKGDYKTGKRLNMRKIIPYIASQYRKDKIWLRRTKPSKREYQIMLALDDSGSMADNHSKKLAFESLILLGKSLNLLEVGEIGIMSFGEETEIVNSFDEPFNDTIGSKLFSKFTFKQKKTRINDLLSKVKFTMENFRSGRKARELSQLLMIISDGRGLFSEGENQLKTKIKQIYESGLFIVFLILDNPENKDSICDIVVPKFESNGEVTLKSYMEEFPFPFYIIVRNIEQLPNVLGQALRQWFELVTINDK